PADGGEADDSVTAVVATGNVGGSMAIAQDTARTRKTLFVVIVGSLALLLAGFGFVMMRRVGARVDDGATAETDPTPAPLAVPGVPSKASSARTYVCPSCRNEFSAGSDFCPHDGNRLVAVGDPALGPRAIATGGICPTCGRGYDP